MGTFNGYLLRAVATNQIFPHEYILFNTWETTPNQREEIKAYREENSRDLHRFTADGEKSTIKFELRPSLHLADIERIDAWFKNAEISAKERKIEVEFWDDDLHMYRSIVCYQPNPKFKIIRIEANDIIYAQKTVELIEY